MKVSENIIEMQIRTSIRIDDMQFVFMPWCSTTDATFSQRQLQENFLKKNKYFLFVEKGFGKKLCYL